MILNDGNSLQFQSFFREVCMSFNWIKNAVTVAAAICATASFAMTQEEGKGSINWTGGYISAVGFGTAKSTGNKAKDQIMAKRASEVVAHRTLLETIKGVKIDSVTTVENLALVEDKIKSRVEGIVKGAQIIDSRVDWVDGSPLATVEMRVCLSGEIAGCKGNGLIGALDLERHKEPAHVPTECLTLGRPLPVPVPAVDVTPATIQQQMAPAQQAVRKRNTPVYDSNRKVTGVVFNLEGRYFEREVLPVVVTKSDNNMITVYCVKNVKPAVVRSYGAVRYADSIDQATKISNLGDNLLIISVADITKENMVIISPEDANILRQTMMNGNDYLNEAKVVISSN